MGILPEEARKCLRECMRNAIYAIAFAALIPWVSHSQILYDINFQTPGQGLNQTVQTGSAPEYISSVVFGNPQVVSSFGGLTDQPLLFTSTGASPAPPGYYTQVQLNLGIPNPPTLDLSFDFTDVGAGHWFIIYFDTPEVRNFEFNQGLISFLNPSLPDDNFGTYTQGHAYHFDIHLNYQLNNWTFYENNTDIGSGAFDASGSSLQSIRFNYIAPQPDVSGTAIDNVIVAVPEPAHLSIMTLALAAFWSVWRRQKSGRRQLVS